MVRVTFYYKDGCWLCDIAEEILHGLKAQYEIDVNKVDITSNENLYDLYRYDIPVFEFKNGSILSGRIRKNDLLRKIEENRE